MSILSQAIGQTFIPAPPLPDGTAEAPTEPLSRALGVKRRLWRGVPVTDELDADAAMAEIERIGWQHIQQGKQHLLAIAAPAGLGKSTLGVRWAERAASTGMRVLYLAPRHDFFADVVALASKPHWWYEWESTQPRKDQLIEMCRFPKEIKLWQNRGYPSVKFCSNPRVCGFDYMRAGMGEVAAGTSIADCSGCKYHAQSGITRRIIFGQHAHLMLGHPLLSQIDVIIGDESPMGAAMHPWIIPGRHIKPAGMDIQDPYTELIDALQTLAQAQEDDAYINRLTGPALLDALGGALSVLVACEEWAQRADAESLNPTLYAPHEVDTVPYFHLLQLGRLLYREALAASDGLTYPHRVIVAQGHLTLLLRRSVNVEALGKPMVWLDATASEPVYQAIFNPLRIEVYRPQVKRVGTIAQVYSRTNNKQALDAERGKQINSDIENIMANGRSFLGKSGGYSNPAIISYKDIVDGLGKPEWPRSHFGGARGTNRLEGCDVLFVVGTPLPDVGDIEKAARMLWWERMDAFKAEWTEKAIPYQSRGRWIDGRFVVGAGDDGAQMAVNGFWDDADLNALLWQMREAELNQAANRARPLRRDVDVWVLSSIPLDIAPDFLIGHHELHTAPRAVARHKAEVWPGIVVYAQQRAAEAGCVTASDLMREFGISVGTAGKYIDLLITALGWTSEPAARPPRGKVAGPKVA